MFLIVCGFIVQVCEILWNVESTVMAVWLEDLVADHSESGQVPGSYGKVQMFCKKNAATCNRMQQCSKKANALEI